MRILPPWLDLDNDLACPTCQGSVHEIQNGLVCGSCGVEYFIYDDILYFIDPSRLTDFEIEESIFHSNVADKADAVHGQSTLRARILHDGFLHPFIRMPKNSRILDIAVGSGVDLVRLVQLGQNVVGVDISPGMIKFAKKKVEALGLSGKIFLCVSDALNLPFRDARFDGAYMCAALHHMRRPSKAMKELARVTLEDGYVSVGSEPNAWLYKFRFLKHSRLGHRIMRFFRDDYTIGEQPPGDRETPGWTRKELIHLMENSGLEVIRIEPVWYLNGIASLLGFNTLSSRLEELISMADKIIGHLPLLKNYSFKWNVIAHKANASSLK